MIYEVTYLFLTLFLAFLIYYRNKANLEGFTSDNRTHTLKVKRAIDPELGLMYKKDKLKKRVVYYLIIKDMVFLLSG